MLVQVTKRHTRGCSVFCIMLILSNLFRKHSYTADLGTVLDLCLLSERLSPAFIQIRVLCLTFPWIKSNPADKEDIINFISLDSTSFAGRFNAGIAFLGWNSKTQLLYKIISHLLCDKNYWRELINPSGNNQVCSLIAQFTSIWVIW